MKLFKASLAIATLALAACAQGTGTVVPVSGEQAATVSPAISRASATQQNTAKVSFLIQWPKRKSNARRHARFVSPSTMSAVLQTGSGKTAVTAIANNDGNATTTLELNAPVGRDTFTVTLYDAPQKAGKPAAGQELGQGVAVQTVVAGKVNALHVAIDGVVAEIGVVLDANSIMASVSGSPGQQSLTLVGDVPATVKLEGFDADGNVIVNPGVSPAMNLQLGYDSTGGLSITPVHGQHNTFVVGAQAASTTGNFGLIATGKDGQGALVTTNIVLVESSATYVSYASGAGAKIAVYDEFGHAMPLPKTAFAGITQPVALTYDADDHRIFVADQAGKILAFDGEGNPVTSFPATSVSGITTIDYFNATNTIDGNHSLTNPQRLIVGGSSGIAEFDATTGEQLVHTSLPFTPTAVSGFVDSENYSTSGWLAMVGLPSGFVEPFDLVTLSPYTDHTSVLSGGKVPAGFGTYTMLASFGFAGDYCFSGHAPIITFINGSSACLYIATGNSSTIVRLGNENAGESGGPFLPTADRATGSLSAIAVDEVNETLAVTQANQNGVEEYGVTDTYDYATSAEIFRLSKKRSYTTPSSLGFSSPNSIAVQW
jgi:hypothetical protein